MSACSAGLPKAAVITHLRLWVIAFFQSICGATSDDVLYICLPLYHSAGFGIGFGGAIERGLKSLFFLLYFVLAIQTPR